MSSNPWDGDTILAFSLGRPQDASSTLRGFGFKSSNCKSEVARSSSLKLIQLLEETYGVCEELNKAACQFHLCTLKRKFKDFIDINMLDKQLNMLETLLNHFVDLVQQRNLLLQRIKRSKDGSHLKIEAAFQKNLSMVISASSYFINNLSDHIALIKNKNYCLRY